MRIVGNLDKSSFSGFFLWTKPDSSELTSEVEIKKGRLPVETSFSRRLSLKREQGVVLCLQNLSRVPWRPAPFHLISCRVPSISIMILFLSFPYLFRWALPFFAHSCSFSFSFPCGWWYNSYYLGWAFSVFKRSWALFYFLK